MPLYLGEKCNAKHVLAEEINSFSIKYGHLISPKIIDKCPYISLSRKKNKEESGFLTKVLGLKCFAHMVKDK